MNGEGTPPHDFLKATEGALRKCACRCCDRGAPAHRLLGRFKNVLTAMCEYTDDLAPKQQPPWLTIEPRRSPPDLIASASNVLLLEASDIGKNPLAVVLRPQRTLKGANNSRQCNSWSLSSGPGRVGGNEKLRVSDRVVRGVWSTAGACR